MTSEIPKQDHREAAAQHIRQAQQALVGITGVGRDASLKATAQRRLNAALDELDAAEGVVDD